MVNLQTVKDQCFFPKKTFHPVVTNVVALFFKACVSIDAYHLPDQHHCLQHPSSGLPQSKYEPSEWHAAGAQHGRCFLQGPTARPQQHTSQLGHCAHAHAAHTRVSHVGIKSAPGP